MRPDDPALGPRVITIGCANFESVPRDKAEKVKSLVYVAALAPDEGETVADVFYRAAPHPQARPSWPLISTMHVSHV